jgi:hypothetical protein
MVDITIEVSQFEYDISLSIATKLNQENALNEPTIEELIRSTLKILINEYEADPRQVINYYLKRNSL